MAECLAKRLGYPILGREVAQEAARSLGVPAELLERKLGDRPSRWSRFSSLRRAYVVAVQATLAEYAVGGNLVYHGLAGGLLVRGLPRTLCLRLIAPMEIRIKALMDEDPAVDAATAGVYIRDVDESRARWVRVMYGEDIMDPGLYDLVINLETMTVEGACALTARAVRQPEYALNDAVLASLEDFRLACRVKVALASDAEVRTMELTATARGGEVVISGEAPLRKSGQTGERIVALARAVQGVDRVRLNLEWYDPYP
jgi:cytidylate kinase